MSQRLFCASLAAAMAFLIMGFDRNARADPRPGREEQVGRLLEACHRAFVARQYDRAARLAEKALALDRDCVAAHPLVYKMDLLTQVKKHARSTPLAEDVLPSWLLDQEEADEDDADPDADDEDDQAARPPLPCIDPKIIDALEKALAGTGDPQAGKFILLSSEPGAGNGQEEPLSHWPYVPQALEVPSLLGEPESADPDAAADEEDESLPGEAAAPRDFNDLLREAVDALRGGSYIDIDVSQEDCTRARFEMQLGPVDLTLMWGNTGDRCAILRWVPEAAAQTAK
jgi:hypothetical protein